MSVAKAPIHLIGPDAPTSRPFAFQTTGGTDSRRNRSLAPAPPPRQPPVNGSGRTVVRSDARDTTHHARNEPSRSRNGDRNGEIYDPPGCQIRPDFRHQNGERRIRDRPERASAGLWTVADAPCRAPERGTGRTTARTRRNGQRCGPLGAGPRPRITVERRTGAACRPRAGPRQMGGTSRAPGPRPAVAPSTWYVGAERLVAAPGRLVSPDRPTGATVGAPRSARDTGGTVPRPSAVPASPRPQ